MNIFKDFLGHEGLDINHKKNDVLAVLSQIDKNDASIQEKYESIKNGLAGFFVILKAEEGYYHNKFFKNERSIGLSRAFLKGTYDFVKLI